MYPTRSSARQSHGSRIRPVAAVISAAIVLSQAAPALAAGGDLDPSFGLGGTVLTAVNPPMNCHGRGVAIDASGRFVVAVSSYTNPTATERDFYAGRFNADGSLDSSFGTGGFARVSITSAADIEGVYTIAVQPDGKILLAGGAPLGRYLGVAVARLNADGTIDTGFGTAGKIQFNFASKQNGSCFDMALQSNGAIVIAGNSELNFGVARLTPSGQLDSSFGSGGKLVVATASRGISVGGARGVVIQTIDGEERILVAGTKPRTMTTPGQFALMRLRPNGAFDTSFGSGGKVFSGSGGPGDFGEALAIDPANNIVVAGRALPTDGRSSSDFAVARYNSSGALLATIVTNVGGSSGLGDTADSAYGVAIQATGEIVAAGDTDLTSDSSDFAVLRYTSDLSALDATFGVSGIVLTDFAGGKDTAPGGVTLQTVDGVEKIVVVGGASSTQYVALARYLE